jgi:hypothetical protein
VRLLRAWRKSGAVTLVALALPTLALTQEQKPQTAPRELRIVRGVVTTGVINREPIDAATAFPPSVGALYYFTEVVGASTPTQINHIWYYDGQKIAEIPLPIASPRWRTWSRKQILQNWIGSWEVEAVDPDGHVLSSQTFDITE